jgi:two-component sensor histidine kinase
MYRYAANPLHHIVLIYGATGQYNKGVETSHKAQALVKGKGWFETEMNIMDDLKMLYGYLGVEDSVLFYDRERLQAAINFRTNQFEVNTEMVEALFTQKENEQTIREQSAELRNELLEKEAIDRERITLLIIVSLIVIILLIIFIYAFNQRKLQKKLARENTEKEKKNEQLLTALGANEALVQEISHRVKNNLAVLAGLLTMQSNRSDSEKVKRELKDSVLRIESIATIHKKLYDKRSDARVNLKDALEELSRNVVAAMGKDPDTDLVTNIADIEVDIAEAVTLCLIINEAITNSCKYANVNERKKVHLELESDEGLLYCRVIDHGDGFDENELSAGSKSLGVYLIRLLSKQLGATLNWTKTDETFFLSIELKSDG